jgi:hypothetical protein
VKAPPSEPRRVEDVRGVKHHSAIRAGRGRRQVLDEGRQPARGTHCLDAAHDDAISADRQRIAFVLGKFSHWGDTDWLRQHVEVGATAKLDADGGDVLARCASRGLDRFEPEPGVAGNILPEAINDRLECRFGILDTDSTPDSQLPGVERNVEGRRDHLVIGGNFASEPLH